MNEPTDDHLDKNDLSALAPLEFITVHSCTCACAYVFLSNKNNHYFFNCKSINRDAHRISYEFFETQIQFNGYYISIYSLEFLMNDKWWIFFRWFFYLWLFLVFLDFDGAFFKKKKKIAYWLTIIEYILGLKMPLVSFLMLNLEIAFNFDSCICACVCLCRNCIEITPPMVLWVCLCIWPWTHFYRNKMHNRRPWPLMELNESSMYV